MAAEEVVWSAADGATTVVLTDEAAGYRVLANGTTGLRSVTYEITASRYAGIDGSTVNAVRADPNEPTLGVLVQANNETDFAARARGLVRAMRPKAGPGTLTVTRNGVARSLACYCAGGLEGDESVDVTLPGRWWKMLLRFYAPDPWWYGAEQSFAVGLGAPVSFFPIPPVTLSSSTVQGEFTLDLSDADDVAFPLWTVTGPGTQLTLTNSTTGRVIEVSADLSAGQTMTIDTRQGHQSVRRDDGTNLMGSLGSDPALWPLVDGENVISAQLLGATAESRIEAMYRVRYAGI